AYNRTATAAPALTYWRRCGTTACGWYEPTGRATRPWRFRAAASGSRPPEGPRRIGGDGRTGGGAVLGRRRVPPSARGAHTAGAPRRPSRGDRRIRMAGGRDLGPGDAFVVG